MRFVFMESWRASGYPYIMDRSLYGNAIEPDYIELYAGCGAVLCGLGSGDLMLRYEVHQDDAEQALSELEAE